MRKHVLVLPTSAFILACGAITASAQQGAPVSDSPVLQQPDQQQKQQQPTIQQRPGMMGQEGLIGPLMMRIIFTLIDVDGDGTISLQEFQAAHERMFKAMDANKDGRLTLEEIHAFMLEQMQAFLPRMRSVPQQ